MTADHRVLVPFVGFEVADVHYAARWAGVTPKCIRQWCERHGVGRKIAGRFFVSRLALPMFVEGDRETLARYHAGDRGPEVLAYLTRMQTPRGGF